MEVDLSSALSGAQALLGCKLIHDGPEGRTSGYIVETEAYTMEDPASHTFHGQTLRNAAMFGPAGTVYVYFTYGMHYCMNIVCGPVGEGQGVLIRALEPLEGVDLMFKRRRVSEIRQLTNGPAKLAQAMAITIGHNNSQLNVGPLRLESGIVPESIVQTARVGISRAIDTPWRFYIAGNQFVSRPVRTIIH